MKKLWKYKYFRTAAAAVCLTVLGLSFSLAGRKTADPPALTGETEVRESAETGADRETQDMAPAGPEIRASGTETADTGASGTGPAESKAGAALLHVYVCGSVNRPEVYVLPEGSRITDAVRAAGGFSEAAARNARNLAEPLTDGEMIYIPTEEEWTASAARGNGPAQTALRSMPEGTENGTADGRIDLNTARAEDLMTLPGIGQSKAERIIAWREQNGPFRSAEDLMKIPGIKQATYDQLKNRITAE